jgi:hypothetical protein
MKRKDKKECRRLLGDRGYKLERHGSNVLFWTCGDEDTFLVDSFVSANALGCSELTFLSENFPFLLEDEPTQEEIHLAHEEETKAPKEYGPNASVVLKSKEGCDRALSHKGIKASECGTYGVSDIVAIHQKDIGRRHRLDDPWAQEILRNHAYLIDSIDYDITHEKESKAGVVDRCATEFDRLNGIIVKLEKKIANRDKVIEAQAMSASVDCKTIAELKEKLANKCELVSACKDAIVYHKERIDLLKTKLDKFRNVRDAFLEVE